MGLALAINRGSSSIKFAVYPDDSETPVISGKLERIGFSDSVFRAWDGARNPQVDRRLPLPGHEAALKTLLDWLHGRKLDLQVVGHRVVHGGPKYDSPCLVTPRGGGGAARALDPARAGASAAGDWS